MRSLLSSSSGARETSESLCALPEHLPLLGRGDGDPVGGYSDGSHGNGSFCLLLVDGALSCEPIACKWPSGGQIE